MAEWKAECEAVDKAHQQALLEWEDVNRTHTEREWELASARAEAANKGFYMQYAKEIGVFWGRYSEALPRGINGYPIFETVRIMHREDHVRAVAAIKRELEHRKAFEV